MKIAILLPTIYRPMGLYKAISSLWLHTDINLIDVCIACEIDDDNPYTYAQKFVDIAVCEKRLQGPGYAWNIALQYLEKHNKKYDAYYLASDDIEFCPGWLDETLKVLQDKLDGSGLVATNEGTDKVKRAGFATQYLMTRDFIRDHNGGIAAYPYPTDFSDVESSMRAQKVNKFAYAEKAVVRHLWRENNDEAYIRSDKLRKDAKTIFEDRKSKGFPDDFERIIK